MISFSITPHHSYKLLYVILKDDTEWRTVHQSIVRANFLKWPIECSSEMEWRSMWGAVEMKGAKAFALRRLTKKSYSSFELEKLLKQHFVSTHIIDTLLQEFKEKQLLDDNDWIESFVQKEIRQKLSPRMIFAKLKMKGLPSEMIHECLKRTYTDNAKKQVLQMLIEKEKSKDKRKIVAKLARKGFQIDDILSVMKE